MRRNKQFAKRWIYGLPFAVASHSLWFEVTSRQVRPPHFRSALAHAWKKKNEKLGRWYGTAKNMSIMKTGTSREIEFTRVLYYQITDGATTTSSPLRS